VPFPTDPAHFPPEIFSTSRIFSSFHFQSTYRNATNRFDDGSGVTSIQTVHPRDRSLKAKRWYRKRCQPASWCYNHQRFATDIISMYKTPGCLLHLISTWLQLSWQLAVRRMAAYWSANMLVSSLLKIQQTSPTSDHKKTRTETRRATSNDGQPPATVTVPLFSPFVGNALNFRYNTRTAAPNKAQFI